MINFNIEDNWAKLIPLNVCTLLLNVKDTTRSPDQGWGASELSFLCLVEKRNCMPR